MIGFLDQFKFNKKWRFCHFNIHSEVIILLIIIMLDGAIFNLSYTVSYT